MKKISLKEKFQLFSDHWDPKIIGELNGQHLKLAKFKGEFVRHKHDLEDELFFVVKGSMKIEFDDRIEQINEGELIIVPKGVYHKPFSDNECHVMLFEPKSTLNTGNITGDLTKKSLNKI